MDGTILLRTEDVRNSLLYYGLKIISYYSYYFLVYKEVQINEIVNELLRCVKKNVRLMLTLATTMQLQ